jgi:hypothetical protein
LLGQFCFRLHSLFTTNPSVMKSLIVAAFTICTCVVAHAQQTELPNESRPAHIQNTELSSPPPEPLYVIAEDGIKREVSTDEMSKLNIFQIESVEMVFDAESLKEYGEKGKNGVMIIWLKEEE